MLRYMHTDWEGKINLSSSIDDMIVYIENLKELTKTRLELRSNITRLPDKRLI